MLEPLPARFVEDFFLPRRRFVEEAARGVFREEGLVSLAYRLSPMVATCGPAGVNVAPFMVSFLVREEHLAGVVERLRRFVEGGPRSMAEAAGLLLDTVYNPSIVDPLRLATHAMSRGHTWRNIEATGEASLGILVPPDKAAYELRARAWVVEEGPIYEYVNLVHDAVHVAPHGERSHPWFPAIVFEIREIYDNSYQALGRRIYPP
ncbi:MAG: hypothetical protein QI199_00615 [Candidatus Korarchaeota archaeon]|nr:hypothetical protein [Candidatus Korarchaeota archaeon]